MSLASIPKPPGPPPEPPPRPKPPPPPPGRLLIAPRLLAWTLHRCETSRRHHGCPPTLRLSSRNNRCDIKRDSLLGMLVFGTFSINWSGLFPRSTFPIAVMIRTMVCRLRHRTGTSHECPGGGTTGAATDNEKVAFVRRQGHRNCGKLVCQPLYNFE